ncbi:ficolin-2-like isoform X2 [Dendronephthya gigantea]|uniref:ficolin-2-like isoform X2 n=1 Tax=Dendronephthya gigantea TaxID=151771 RepID=UPI00106986B0|nr:ficolin-2-like isoform X2 [Dendronephthya gigantea]
MRTITILFVLMVEIVCVISQKCSSRIYDNIRTAGPSLPPDKIVSTHTFNSEFVQIECLEICEKELKCIGFKISYRDKMNVVNCQLANVTGKKDHNATTEGEWILMLDNEAAKNEEKRRNDGMNSATSCAHLYSSGVRQNGVYTINPDGLGSFKVRCDMSKDRGGWTVFQRRQDGSQDFYRGWSDYKAGFGDLNGEFWLGLDKIHRLSKSGQNVLRVDLMDFNNVERYAKYGMFSVADESENYRLNIGSYSGDAGDSLAWHNKMQFTTKDSDNDVPVNENCATTWKGAWWYNNCHNSNLNGLYLGAGQTSGSGIKWHGWHYYSMKKTEMKIRPNFF